MITHSLKLAASEVAYWFIVSKGQLYLTSTFTIPCCAFSQLPLALEDAMICGLGELSELPCYLVVYDDQPADQSCWHSARVLLEQGEAIFQLAARACQVALFLQTHRFCGQCGNAMRLVNWELATICHKCGHRCYPRIAPCVLIAVVNKDKILLARSHRHKAGFFSVLAGFVESAETLEEAAKREVAEEVGVQIGNLRYVASQPWPFPHSLMVGFLADYIAGDIRCQPDEIAEAYWCPLTDLPQIPGNETLSGQLITLAQQQLKQQENKQ